MGGKAIRDARYKFIAFEDGATALYDLRRDPHETRDLSTSAEGDAAAAMKTLRAAMDQLSSPEPASSLRRR